ncbi:hypothetical protein LZ645_07730, partial [Shewanella algae]|uniref:hypothetical protein n=1 Tax=Shewanella algae TaxID=38313 RepID=UPI001F2769D5
KLSLMRQTNAESLLEAGHRQTPNTNLINYLVRFIQSLEHKDFTQPVSSIKVLVASLGLEPMDFA